MCVREENKKTCKSLPCDLQVPPSRCGGALLISREKDRIHFSPTRFHVDIGEMIKPRLS